MASSQVEVASNSAFSYVLKERNRCSNSFQKNFKDLVSSCISGHSRSSGQGFIDYADLWVHNPQTGGNENEGSGNNPKMPAHSDGNNENSDDFKDLWVHNPQRNEAKKTTAAGEKYNIAFLPERKKQESSESHSFSRAVPIPNPHKAPERDSSASAPVAATSQRGSNWEAVSSKLLPRKVQHSPNHSESSRGVSSLVRKWRDFEAESKSPVCTSAKGISVLCSSENDPLSDAPGRGSDCCDESVDLRPSTPSKNEDFFFDWESDQTGSCKGRDSDATEKEKIRVADIIKKLTSNGGESNTDRVSSVSHDSALPRVRTSVDKSEVIRPFSPVASSPRLRGRQAFADLLTKMERDRQNELEGLANRKPVSRFSHRGRIQATLRVRFLRRGAEGKDGRPPIPTPSESTKNAQSAVLHMRQKFREANSRSQQKEDVVAKSPLREERISSVSQQTKENHQKELSDFIEKKFDEQKLVRYPVVVFNQQEVKTKEQPNDRQQQQPETSQQEGNSASEDIQQETKSESCRHDKLEVTMKEKSVENITVAGNVESEEFKNQKLVESSNEFPRMTGETQVVEIEHEEDHHSFIVCDYGHETDSFGGEWEEEEDEQSDEANQDWICDVSRPRSAWEDLRQARYQEMLDPFMEKRDIKDLLNRRSVSSFLSSSLRENIDRLMMSRAVESPRRPPLCRVAPEERRDQGEEARSLEMQEEQENFAQAHEEEDRNQNKGYKYGKYKEDEVHSNRECMESHCHVQETSWENSQEHKFSQVHEEEDKNQRKGYKYEKYKEGEIHSSHECMEPRYVVQETPWENSHYHYFASSSFPSPRESHAFDFSSPDTQPSSSFTNHPSIEMQFMYEMRGNMEQLHQEITKLRRSVKSCISMQTKLQKVIGQEPKSHRSGGRKKRKDSSVDKKSSRGRCCICYEMQIDSLLYRCGHMCTCFKCAKDLQWSSGKCPICEAQIIDVVRAYAYS